MAIKAMVRSNPEIFENKGIRLLGHDTTFEGILRHGPQDQVMFVLRDPVDRYVSGFNARRRKGRPTNDVDWDEGERSAFKNFSTPNDLAEALDSSNGPVRAAAERAIASISHTRYPLSYWLHSPEFLETNRDRIFYICEFSSLDEDIENAGRALGLAEHASLPASHVAANRAPTGSPTQLSGRGRRNIENWYASDYPILDWCRAERESIRARLRATA